MELRHRQVLPLSSLRWVRQTANSEQHVVEKRQLNCMPEFAAVVVQYGHTLRRSK